MQKLESVVMNAQDDFIYSTNDINSMSPIYDYSRTNKMIMVPSNMDKDDDKILYKAPILQIIQDIKTHKLLY